VQYYEVLGLSPNAEPQVIDAAYRAMMRTYHPDVYSGSREEAERTSKQLNAAYAVLKDPVKRRAFDSTMADDTVSAEYEQPRSEEPTEADAEEGAEAEPWDWESDPLELRVKRVPMKGLRWGQIVSGMFAGMMIVITLQDAFKH
jgi:curved DNA-binding protein CbpA